MAKRARAAAKAPPKARIARLGLTPARRAKAVELYRASGILARVYEGMNVSRTQFYDWRKDNPDFQAELDSVADEVDLRIGQKARCALEMRLDDILARRRPTEQAIIQRTGQVVELLQPAQYDQGAVNRGLHRLDPRWTTPPKEAVSGGESLEELLRRTDEEDAKRAKRD